MSSETTTTTTGTSGLLDFRAVNVTGTREIQFSVDPNLRVEDVTGSLVLSLFLPDTTAYALRDDGSSRYLNDGNRIGDEIEPGTSVTVTPKTHLG